MAKSDGGLRKLFSTHLPKPSWYWSPIETGSTTGGLPDAHFLNRDRNVAGWVESKKTDGWAIKFEPHQIQWHRFHAEACRTFIAVRAYGQGSSEGFGDSLWLFPGTAVDLLADGGLRAALEGGVELYKKMGPPRTWDWNAVAEVLLEYEFRKRS